MASRIVQYFADKLRTVKEYPITLTKAVYDENGKRLNNKLQEIDNSISDVNSNLNEVKNKFGSNYILGVDIQAGNDYTSEDLSSNIPYDVPILFDIGSKNSEQAFNGFTTVVFYRREQPKLLPMYSYNTFRGLVYINSSNNGTISISNNTDEVIRVNIFSFH